RCHQWLPRGPGGAAAMGRHPRPAARGRRADREDGGTLNMSELIASDWLKARNWTEAAIKRFLGEPDDTKPNPHYKSGPPMRLWLKERAEAVEQTEEFKAWMLKSLERS